MSDELLDHLADLYIGLQVHSFTGVAFWQFLQSPDHYQRQVLHLLAGGGLNICAGQTARVSLH